MEVMIIVMIMEVMIILTMILFLLS